MTDLIQRIEARVAAWLKRRNEKRLLHRFGGIQWCPWCKQCAQTGEGWYFDSDTDPTIDALHCGVCGGVSRWRFELGTMQLDPPGLTPPPVKTAALRASQGEGA